MAMEILAQSLGQLLADEHKLLYLSVPSSMPAKFLETIVESANTSAGMNDFASLVSREATGNSISAESATKLRSRQDGKKARALIVAREGDFKELKSLEAFIPVNPSLVPKGVAGVEHGQLELNTLCEELLRTLRNATSIAPTDISGLNRGLNQVLSFLGDSYRTLGNHDLGWKEAWWKHARFLVDLLPNVRLAENASEHELARAIFASAGLPRPEGENPGEYQHATAKDLAELLFSKWKSGEDAVIAALEVERKAMDLKHLKRNSRHPITGLDWSDFDLTLAEAKHPLLALSTHGSDRSNNLAMWEETRESEFFQDLEESTGVVLRERFADGNLLPVQTFDLSDDSSKNLGPFVLVSAVTGKIEGNCLLLGEYELELKITNQNPVGAAADFELKTSPASFLEATRKKAKKKSPGIVVISFELRAVLPKNGKGKWREKPCKLLIEPKVAPGASPPFFNPIALELFVPLPGNSSIYVSPIHSGKKVKRKMLELAQREYKLDNDDSARSLVEVSDDSKTRELRLKPSQGRVDALIISPSDSLPCTNGHEASNCESSQRRSGLWIFKLTRTPLADGSKLEQGGTTLLVSVEDGGRHPLSPIIAAASGAAPATNETGNQEKAMLSDPRGYLEKHWLKDFYTVNASSYQRQFPMALMFADQSHDGPRQAQLDREKGFFVVGPRQYFLMFSPNQIEAKALARFWEAFDGLGLDNIAGIFDGNTSDWPSRLPLSSISDHQVNRYLDAYNELVQRAKDEDEGGWLYPFSTLVIEKGKVRGIMLSPLHPIRFAWNWSAQYAAYEACDFLEGVEPESLLGFVDGTGIPFCGPVPGDAKGQFVGVPLDPGEDDLFAAWGYLASRDLVNTGSAYPRKVSGFDFPVGAFSGLDRGGVAAAINDYLRVYPYASELRLGLSANAPTPRSNELDRAVVAELDSLLQDRGSQLPGGIKVFDSTNRDGALPDKARVLARVRSAMDILNRDDEDRQWELPFEWRTSDAEKVDIRFLEDPVVDISYESQRKLEATSAMPVLPLKRFHAWSQPNHNQGSGFSPHLSDEQDSLLKSLPAVLSGVEEFRGQRLETWCQVVGNDALLSDSASWTVAGNDNLYPRLLADAILKMGARGQVLWEWRPPYLPRRSNKGQSSMLAARPYTVIARLEEEFKSRIGKELFSVLGDRGEPLLEDLFKTLGSRGVGIASLLTMGHQQSRGAIGFYLGFQLASLWEESAATDEIRMVLPLDAVNPIFEALAGKTTSDDRKKADLLFISCRQTPACGYHLDFHPIEIKMHATEGEPVNFPDSGSSGVRAAVKQLENTKDVLEKFQADLEVSPRPVLASTALASLIETGMMLSPARQEAPEAKQRAELLRAVASGNCTVRVKGGILFWFEKNGVGHQDKPFHIRDHVGLGAAFGLFIDPLACTPFEKSGRCSGLVEAFLRIFDDQKRKDTQSALPRESPTCGHDDMSHASEPVTPAKENKTPPEEVWPETIEALKDESPIACVGDEVTGTRLEILTEEDLNRRYDRIIETLKVNGVTVYRPRKDIDAYTEGPASIMFRVQLAPGVKPGKIDSQREVLKLNLSLSVEDEIRTFVDKGCVVIVVPKPDKERYFVTAQQLWRSWERPVHELIAPLGIDEYREMVSLNFSSSNSPHLLIGGTTGSGKSEALNTILHGLTHHYSPSELRLLLVDPKGTEMADFEGVEHLLGEIGWDDESAVSQLEIAVDEMQDRYKHFQAARTRSITEFNKSRPKKDRLPWWVVVLDEFADLTADQDQKKRIEVSLGRLAQKARAAGIHVIIATQKPSANVISTVLRSNLPAQLALRVKSATESRVIMDDSGAETLNGKGDAFLKSEGKTVRVQCAQYLPA